MSDDAHKMPPDADDHIVEVSLRHVIVAFGGLVVTTCAVGAGIAFARDYAKFRRQKALIDAAKQFLLTIQDGGDNWKNEKTVSSSPTRTSKKSKKSSVISD
ncbi:MAG: hypothetical protein GF353_04975 [Candidatus Lokiarchaeota archaeon]|nr:hypothetical protein [Candidatus Lokiarchaeota archaeon]